MFGTDMTALIAEQHRQELRRQAQQARLALAARTTPHSVKDQRHARPAADQQGVRHWALTRWAKTAAIKDRLRTASASRASRSSSASGPARPTPAA